MRLLEWAIIMIAALLIAGWLWFMQGKADDLNDLEVEAVNSTPDGSP